ncbi:MAG TPA: hypothetical protein VNH18_21780 [Bryobacteraceae bacterium]|nr:hypothetical protein [Bryobacteraceae bacterium]
MMVTIELPDEIAAALQASAKARGISVPDFAQEALAGLLGRTRQPLASRIQEIWKDMPAEVQDTLPADGASQVDHYVYGSAKKES